VISFNKGVLGANTCRFKSSCQDRI